MLHRILKNDLVEVISGRDKGKRGRVIAIDLKKDRVLVKGVAIVTKHAKARRQGEQSSIRKEEAFIFLSKVVPICSSCKKGCRVQTKSGVSDEKKMRICHHCKEAI